MNVKKVGSKKVIGVQKNGSSSSVIYRTCKAILQSQGRLKGSLVDIGGGKGNLAKLLQNHFSQTCLLDYAPDEIPGIQARAVNLNSRWPLSDDEFDVAVALEIVEHLENPRHFFRELIRVTKPGGFAVISTPNQVSLASKICFLLRSQHQHFQDSCYPAHITALLPIDMARIAAELGQEDGSFNYTGFSRIPGTKRHFNDIIPWARGALFSDNVFFSFKVDKAHSC